MSLVDLLEKLLSALPAGEVVEVVVGKHWTAVVVEHDLGIQCGLASTIDESSHMHHLPGVPAAGHLHEISALDLASYALADSGTMRSVGIAAINALLPREVDRFYEANAVETLSLLGEGRNVVLVGHFPFVPRLKDRLSDLLVLELDPRPGDRHISEASALIPGADVVAITAMTLINRTLDDIFMYLSADSKVIMIGPSTPLSPILFEFGIDIISGSIVESIGPVLRTVQQGGNFRQVHKAGVKLVNLAKY